MCPPATWDRVDWLLRQARSLVGETWQLLEAQQAATVGDSAVGIAVDRYVGSAIAAAA